MRTAGFRLRSFPLNRFLGPRLIDGVTGIVILGTLGIGIWVWFAMNDQSLLGSPDSLQPFSSSELRPSQEVKSSTTNSMAASDRPPASNDPVWQRPLQFGFRQRSAPMEKQVAPPVIAVTPPAQPTRPPVSHLGLRLLGTVLEHDRSMLIAMDRTGRLDFRNVGAELALEPSGIHIDSISKEFVLVSYQGKSREWRLGELLSFETESAHHSPAGTNREANPAPRMSIEDELERINRVPGTDP